MTVPEVNLGEESAMTATERAFVLNELLRHFAVSCDQRWIAFDASDQHAVDLLTAVYRDAQYALAQP